VGGVVEKTTGRKCKNRGGVKRPGSKRCQEKEHEIKRKKKLLGVVRFKEDGGVLPKNECRSSIERDAKGGKEGSEKNLAEGMHKNQQGAENGVGSARRAEL